MKTTNQNIKPKTKLFKNMIAILLSLILAFSCFTPKAIAHADEIQHQQIEEVNTNVDNGLLPAIKSPFTNPLQIVINTVYKKLLGPAHTKIENTVTKVLNWIFGIEPESTESPEKKLQELQKSIDEFKETFKTCNANILNALSKIMVGQAQSDIVKAVGAAQMLFENTITQPEIQTINYRLEKYNTAKKAGDENEMRRNLSIIAKIYGSDIVHGLGQTNLLATTFNNLYRLSLTIGKETCLDSMYDKLLIAEPNLDKVSESFTSLYNPMITLMNKMNDYQVISLAALKEHENLCKSEDQKIAKDITDSEIGEYLKLNKNVMGQAMDKLKNLNERINNAPNVILTRQTTEGTETIRYHSFADAWTAAQDDNVKSAKLTLNSDYVYNGDEYNYFGEEIKLGNRNMRFDLSPNNFLNGDEKMGFFLNGNLNVKSGKNIEIDLNSHVLANLTNDNPTITVQPGATLNIGTDMVEGQFNKGQIGSVKYENGANGWVRNVKFSDKYSFSKFHIYKAQTEQCENANLDKPFMQNADNNDSYPVIYTRYEYKQYENVNGAQRNHSAIWHHSGGKNFEVLGCDFDNINNIGQTYGTALDLCGRNNMMKTDDKGNVIDKCAITNVLDCTFNNIKSRAGSVIAVSKNFNCDNCSFQDCSSKEGAAVAKRFQVEGDTCDMKGDIGAQFDPKPVTFNNCQFNNNSSDRSGGALDILGEVKINDCQFNNNTSSSGGAIFQMSRRDVYKAHTMISSEEYSTYDDMFIINTTFTNNHANKKSKIIIGYGDNETDIGGNGGAISTVAGDIKTTNVTFTDNSAENDGGAINEIHTDKWGMSCSEYNNTTFSHNKAVNNGGALSHNTDTKFNNVTITDNYAGNNGGGTYGQHGGDVLRNLTVKNNKCGKGRGAGMHIEMEVFLHENVIITDNYIDNGEPSDLRVVNRLRDCILPEKDFCSQDGSNVGLDLKDTGNVITDVRHRIGNKGWAERLEASKRYMHSNDGRSINVHSKGWWLSKKHWLQVD